MTGRLLTDDEQRIARAALAANGETATAFADRTGLRRALVSDILTGKHVVIARATEAIQALIDGGADDLVRLAGDYRARRA